MGQRNMKQKQRITPHLWFDKEAIEAAELYTSIFPNSMIKNTRVIHDTPSGDASIITLQLLGQEFMFISGGPYFKLNPSISFLVACSTEEEVDMLWTYLSEEGSTLMELGEYPFSGRYGWIQDKYGVSWQLMLTDINSVQQRITPTLMFVGDVYGKAQEAIDFYTSVFHDSEVHDILRYTSGEEPDREGTIKHAGFRLEGLEFASMDSAHPHDFSFNEAVSFIIHCENQDEINYYWSKLSAVPEAEQCGWLKDKYGLSWQVVPTVLNELLSDKDPQNVMRVTQAFLKMKKFDIAKLKQASAA